MTPIAEHTEPWLRHLGFGLTCIKSPCTLFASGETIQNTAGTAFPFSAGCSNDRARTTWRRCNTPTSPDLRGVAGHAGRLAAWIVHQRVKPE